MRGAEINAAFGDLVRRSRSGLQHKENDNVDQDHFGSRARVRRHPRRSGVCWSQDLRVFQLSVRQLGRHGRSLLRLSRAGAISAATSEDGRPRAGHPRG